MINIGAVHRRGNIGAGCSQAGAYSRPRELCQHQLTVSGMKLADDNLQRDQESGQS